MPGTTSFCENYTSIQSYFLSHGYGPNEVYCTTYWSGNSSNNEAMGCYQANQIGVTIINIYGYTGRKVNVLGYSMGALIARKAAKGGPCQDIPSISLSSTGSLINKVGAGIVTETHRRVHYPSTRLSSSA